MNRLQQLFNVFLGLPAALPRTSHLEPLVPDWSVFDHPAYLRRRPAIQI